MQLYASLVSLPRRAARRQNVLLKPVDDSTVGSVSEGALNALCPPSRSASVAGDPRLASRRRGSSLATFQSETNRPTGGRPRQPAGRPDADKSDGFRAPVAKQNRLPEARARIDARRRHGASASYIDGDGWFGQFHGALLGVHGDLLACFDAVLDVQRDGFAGVCQGFFVGMTPGVATLKGRTGSVPRWTSILELILLDDDLENVGFHSQFF